MSEWFSALMRVLYRKAYQSSKWMEVQVVSEDLERRFTVPAQRPICINPWVGANRHKASATANGPGYIAYFHSTDALARSHGPRCSNHEQRGYRRRSRASPIETLRIRHGRATCLMHPARKPRTTLPWIHRCDVGQHATSGPLCERIHSDAENLNLTLVGDRTTTTYRVSSDCVRPLPSAKCRGLCGPRASPLAVSSCRPRGQNITRDTPEARGPPEHNLNASHLVVLVTGADSTACIGGHYARFLMRSQALL
ncbi:hypothetical protein C8Q73DRAFT_219680 [Cubamyces lactineus]|nr:hypothetical protein C8Q73DRAFT_219680 [Cubamyces lactineus]